MATLNCAGRVVSGDHFIADRRVASSRTLAVASPIDGTPLGEIAAGDASAAAAAVAAAARAFPAWAALGPAGRGPILRRLAALIERDVDPLAQVETTNNGSLLEAGRLRVMARAAANIRFFADLAETLAAPEWDTAAANAHNRVRYDPAGATALITPWNAPLMLASWKVGPALAAGNTVVLKPAEWTPITGVDARRPGPRGGRAGRRAQRRAGAGSRGRRGAGRQPPGAPHLVHRLAGDRSRHRRRGGGEPHAGKLRTRRKVAAHRLSTTPISTLAVDTAAGQYDNAGQVCLAGTRLLVQRSIHAELPRAPHGQDRGDRGSAIPRDAEHPGRPADPSAGTSTASPATSRGRVTAGARLAVRRTGVAARAASTTSRRCFTTCQRAPRSSQRRGLRAGADAPDLRRRRRGGRLANGTEYGLAGVVYTRDRARADRVADALVAGTVWVNCFFVRDLEAPFGGARESGIGREGGHWSFDFYCDVKNVGAPNGTLLGGV